MPTFEDTYLYRINQAQDLKMKKDEAFLEAVENIYSLLGATMEGGAYKDAKATWDKIQKAKAATLKMIKAQTEMMEEFDKKWKPEIMKSRALWQFYEDFLKELIDIGHRYSLFPRMTSPEQTESSRGITER